MSIQKSISFLCAALMVTWLLVGLVIYIPDMGGTGLELPPNILCWLMMSGVVVLSALSATGLRSIRLHGAFYLMLPGVGCFMLPLLWATPLQRVAFAPRGLALAGGLLFFLALLQLRLTEKTKKGLIAAIVMAALIQSVLAFWQVTRWSPDNWMEFSPGSRPYGIFQQVNVLGSFVATGLAASAWLYFSARRHVVMVLNLMSIALLVATLQLLQSRAAYLGALVFCALMLGTCGRQHVRKTLLFLTIVLATVLTLHVAKMLFPDWGFLSVVGSVDKSSSNHERIAILKATLWMILQHPLSGWGYGSYGASVAGGSVSCCEFVFPENIPHAHNEFLFEWAEGGIMAAVGSGLLFLGFAQPLLKANGQQRLVWGLSIPILLHLMTEYPLFQSATHLFLLLLIARMALPEEMLSRYSCPRVFPVGMATAALAGILFLVTGLKTGATLTSFERKGMSDFSEASTLVNPWSQWRRYQFDRHTAMLMEFNQTHDRALLQEYAVWGRDYLMQKVDRHVYDNLINIARFTHDISLWDWLNSDACLIYRSPAAE